MPQAGLLRSGPLLPEALRSAPLQRKSSQQAGPSARVLPVAGLPLRQRRPSPEPAQPPLFLVADTAAKVNAEKTTAAVITDTVSFFIDESFLSLRPRLIVGIDDFRAAERKKRFNSTHDYALLLNLWRSSRSLNGLQISSILFILPSFVNHQFIYHICFIGFKDN